MIYLAAAVALMVVFFILHSTKGEDEKLDMGCHEAETARRY